jgi:hypothetical protein
MSNTLRITGTDRGGEAILYIDWPDGSFDSGAIPREELGVGNGQALYAAAFGARSVAELLSRCSTGRDEKLRIELRVTDALLSDAWEKMTDSEGVVLPTHPNVSLIRTPLGRSQPIQRVSLEDIPSALFLYADPRGKEHPLKAEEYFTKLEPLLQAFPMRVEKKLLRRQELNALASGSRAVHLVHILAHGRGDLIALQGATPHTIDWCAYAEFAETLARLPGLRVVVLHTCLTLRLGLMLAAKGLTAVAWNGSPRPELPWEFWHSFYGVELARSLDPCEAVHVARQTLREADLPERFQLTCCTPASITAYLPSSGSAATATVKEELRERVARETWKEVKERSLRGEWQRLASLGPRPLAGPRDFEALTILGRAWSELVNAQTDPRQGAKTLRSILPPLEHCTVPAAFQDIFRDQCEQLRFACRALESMAMIDGAAQNDRWDRAVQYCEAVEKDLEAFPLAGHAVGHLVRSLKSDVDRIVRYRSFLHELDDHLFQLARESTNVDLKRWQDLKARAAFLAPWEAPHAGPVALVPVQLDFYVANFQHQERVHRILREVIEPLAEGLLDHRLVASARVLSRVQAYLALRAETAPEKLSAIAELLLRMIERALMLLNNLAAAAGEHAARAQLEALLGVVSTGAALGRETLGACAALRDLVEIFGTPSVRVRITAVESGIRAPIESLCRAASLVNLEQSKQVHSHLIAGRHYDAARLALGPAVPIPTTATQSAGGPLGPLLQKLDATAQTLAQLKKTDWVDAVGLIQRYPGLFTNLTVPVLLPTLCELPLNPYLVLASRGVRPGLAVDESLTAAGLDEESAQALALLRDPERRLQLDARLFPVDNPGRLEEVMRELRQLLLRGEPLPALPADLDIVDRAALLCLLNQPEQGARLLWERIGRNPGAGPLVHAAFLCLLAAASQEAERNPNALASESWPQLVASLGLLLVGARDSYLEPLCERWRTSCGSGAVATTDEVLAKWRVELCDAVQRCLTLAWKCAKDKNAEPETFADLMLSVGAELDGAAALREIKGIDARELGRVVGGRLAVGLLGLESALAQSFSVLCGRRWVRERDWDAAAQHGLTKETFDGLIRNFTPLWRAGQLLGPESWQAAEAALRSVFPPGSLEFGAVHEVDASDVAADIQPVAVPLFAQVEPQIALALLRTAALGIYLKILLQKAVAALPPAGEARDQRAMLHGRFRLALKLATELDCDGWTRQWLATVLAEWADSWLKWIHAASPEQRAAVSHVPLLLLRPVYYDFFEDNAKLRYQLTLMHAQHGISLADVQHDFGRAADEFESVIALEPATPTAYCNLAILVGILAVKQATRGDISAALERCDDMLKRLKDYQKTYSSTEVQGAREQLSRIRSQIYNQDEGLASLAEQLRGRMREHALEDDDDSD